VPDVRSGAGMGLPCFADPTGATAAGRGLGSGGCPATETDADTDERASSADDDIEWMLLNPPMRQPSSSEETTLGASEEPESSRQVAPLKRARTQLVCQSQVRTARSPTERITTPLVGPVTRHVQKPESPPTNQTLAALGSRPVSQPTSLVEMHASKRKWSSAEKGKQPHGQDHSRFGVNSTYRGISNNPDRPSWKSVKPYPTRSLTHTKENPSFLATRDRCSPMASPSRSQCSHSLPYSSTNTTASNPIASAMGLADPGVPQETNVMNRVNLARNRSHLSQHKPPRTQFTAALHFPRPSISYPTASTEAKTRFSSVADYHLHLLGKATSNQRIIQKNPTENGIKRLTSSFDILKSGHGSTTQRSFLERVISMRSPLASTDSEQCGKGTSKLERAMFDSRRAVNGLLAESNTKTGPTTQTRPTKNLDKAGNGCGDLSSLSSSLGHSGAAEFLLKPSLSPHMMERSSDSGYVDDGEVSRQELGDGVMRGETSTASTNKDTNVSDQIDELDNTGLHDDAGSSDPRRLIPVPSEPTVSDIGNRCAKFRSWNCIMTGKSTKVPDCIPDTYGNIPIVEGVNSKKQIIARPALSAGDHHQPKSGGFRERAGVELELQGEDTFASLDESRMSTLTTSVSPRSSTVSRAVGPLTLSGSSPSEGLILSPSNPDVCSTILVRKGSTSFPRHSSPCPSVRPELSSAVEGLPEQRRKKRTISDLRDIKPIEGEDIVLCFKEVRGGMGRATDSGSRKSKANSGT